MFMRQIGAAVVDVSGICPELLLRGLAQYSDTVLKKGFSNLAELHGVEDQSEHSSCQVALSARVGEHIEDQKLQAMGFLPGHVKKLKRRPGPSPNQQACPRDVFFVVLPVACRATILHAESPREPKLK